MPRRSINGLAAASRAFAAARIAPVPAVGCGSVRERVAREKSPNRIRSVTVRPARFAALARRVTEHAVPFWMTSEDLPDPDNRVTLDRNGDIVLSYRPNNDEGHRRLIARLERLMQAQAKCMVHGHDCHQGLFARNLFLGQRIPLAGVAHQNGTIRFGHDPRASALDVNCRAHEVDNLYVVDASFFPSSAAVNPALTIMANALRVGDRLKDRLR